MKILPSLPTFPPKAILVWAEETKTSASYALPGLSSNVSPHVTLAVTSQLLVLSTAEVITWPHSQRLSAQLGISPLHTPLRRRRRQLLAGSCCPSLGLPQRQRWEALPGPPLFHVLFIGLQFNKPFTLSVKLSVSYKDMLTSSTGCICGHTAKLPPHNPQLFTPPHYTQDFPIWPFSPLSSFSCLGQ